MSVQAQVMNLLKRLKAERALGMIFITHDIALASDLCDRIVVAYGGEHVESGSAEEVILAPKHPYTQKLLASIPRMDGAEKPEFLEGSPPDLVDPPSGCRFHPRCPYAFEPCAKEPPPSFKVGESRGVRCWLYATDAPPREPGPGPERGRALDVGRLIDRGLIHVPEVLGREIPTAHVGLHQDVIALVAQRYGSRIFHASAGSPPRRGRSGYPGPARRAPAPAGGQPPRWCTCRCLFTDRLWKSTSRKFSGSG